MNPDNLSEASKQIIELINDNIISISKQNLNRLSNNNIKLREMSESLKFDTQELHQKMETMRLNEEVRRFEELTHHNELIIKLRSAIECATSNLNNIKEDNKKWLPTNEELNEVQKLQTFLLFYNHNVKPEKVNEKWIDILNKMSITLNSLISQFPSDLKTL